MQSPPVQTDKAGLREKDETNSDKLTNDTSVQSNLVHDIETTDYPNDLTQTCTIDEVKGFLDMARHANRPEVLTIPIDTTNTSLLSQMLSWEGQILSKVLTFIADDMEAIDYEALFDHVIDNILKTGVHEVFDRVDLGKKGSGAMILALCANILLILSAWNLVVNLVIRGVYKVISTLGLHLKLHGFHSCDCQCRLPINKDEAKPELGDSTEHVSMPRSMGYVNFGSSIENVADPEGSVNTVTTNLENPHANFGDLNSFGNSYPLRAGRNGFWDVPINSEMIPMTDPFNTSSGNLFEDGNFHDPLGALQDTLPQRSIFQVFSRRPGGRPPPSNSCLNRFLAIKVEPPTVPNSPDSIETAPDDTMTAEIH